MFGWLSRIFASAAGAIDDVVRHWVHDVITGLYGFLHTIFSFVGDAWIRLYRDVAGWYEEEGRFIGEAVRAFGDLWIYVIPRVIGWAARELASLLKFAESILHWAISEFDRLRHDIARWLDDLRHWIITDIWDPIWRTLKPAWDWITHEGATLWFYLTHLDKFWDLIWNDFLVKVEKEAWRAGKILGRFFLSLILHNLHTFTALLEDILNAVL